MECLKKACPSVLLTVFSAFEMLVVIGVNFSLAVILDLFGNIFWVAVMANDQRSQYLAELFGWPLMKLFSNILLQLQF